LSFLCRKGYGCQSPARATYTRNFPKNIWKVGIDLLDIEASRMVQEVGLRNQRESRLRAFLGDEVVHGYGLPLLIYVSDSIIIFRFIKARRCAAQYVFLTEARGCTTSKHMRVGLVSLFPNACADILGILELLASEVQVANTPARLSVCWESRPS